MVRTKQLGFSLWLLPSFIVLILSGALAFKVLIPYMDLSMLQRVTQKTLSDVKTDPSLTEYDIQKKIFDRANVQSVFINFENIQVKPINPGEYNVHVDMPIKLSLWKNAYFLLDLSVDENTR